eukprot:7009343-Alexandrium_andersonii.AAC.1
MQAGTCWGAESLVCATPRLPLDALRVVKEELHQLFKGGLARLHANVPHDSVVDEIHYASEDALVGAHRLQLCAALCID